MTRFVGTLAATLLLALFPAPDVAANPLGSLAGKVVDETGAVLPNARVTVRREAVGFEQAAVTDGTGQFHVELPAGPYEVTAESDGFSLSRKRIEVGARPAEVRFTLHPGGFDEEMTVVGATILGGPEAVRRIPGSMEVLSPDLLESSRVRDVSEALRKASGVTVRDEEGLSLRPNIGIRGLNPTRSSKTLLLEDGVPLSYAPYGDNASYYHPPIERFESVEILKGAGQISYGPVTVGGVVNYLTPDPPQDLHATARLSGGSRDYLNAHATAGGTFGRTGLLLDVMRKGGDGSRDAVHSDLTDATLKAVVSLSSRHTLTLKGNFYGEDSQVTYSGLRLAEWQADPRQNAFGNDEFTGRRVGFAARHNALLGSGLLLSTQAYWSRFSRDWWRQSSNSGQRPNDVADPSCGGMANLSTTCGNEGRLRDYDTWGVEPRLRFGHGLFGARGETEVGVRAHFEVQERIQKNGDTPLARDGRVVEANNRENTAWSGFVQERLLLGRFTVTPGLRFEAIDYERTNRLANSGAGVTGQSSVTQWVPGLGVAWNADDRFALFGGLHRGFAPPRTEDVISNAGGSVELDPELSWNLELGLRGAPRPGLRFDATWFRMDYENQVVAASLAGGVGAALTNGGETLHQGFEIGARVDTGTLLQSRHNLFARVSFTAVPTARFEGLRYSNVSGFSRTSVSGNRLPYSPEQALNAMVGYRHPSGVLAQVEAVSTSDQFADDLNSVESSADGQRGLVPGYTTWNATVSYDLRALDGSVFVAVKNLTDELYIADRSRGLLPGLPRLVQVGVVARF
ncbi:MAG: TonB-dependent receptor [Vicinamibacteria bacterium]|nr:TonB-dependent receptor [Vicinamibacteria bacterium]